MCWHFFPEEFGSVGFISAFKSRKVAFIYTSQASVSLVNGKLVGVDFFQTVLWPCQEVRSIFGPGVIARVRGCYVLQRSGPTVKGADNPIVRCFTFVGLSL